MWRAYRGPGCIEVTPTKTEWTISALMSRGLTSNNVKENRGQGRGKWRGVGGRALCGTHNWIARRRLARSTGRGMAWHHWTGSARHGWTGSARLGAWRAAFAPQAGRLDPHRRGIPPFDRPAPLSTITLFQTRRAHFFSFGPPTPFFLRRQLSNPTPANPLKRKKGPPAGTHI